MPQGNTLAIDALDGADGMAFAAADVASRAQALLAQSADLENVALTTVARYEAQRDLVLDLLARLHAAEVAGEAATALRARFLEAEQEKRRLWRNVERLWKDAHRCEQRARELERLADALRLGAEGLWRSDAPLSFVV